MSHIEKKSPSQKKCLKLTFDRELHFGPFVFSVDVEGFYTERNLGYITDDLCWSENDRYLAVVEIIFDKTSKTNYSILNLVDTDTGKVNPIHKKKGLIKPKSVSNNGLITY